MTEAPTAQPGSHDFAVVSSKDIYRGRILALRSDDIVMPGDGVRNREVVEHFGAVAIVALDDAGEVVVIHQYRHPLGRRLWELPAGLLDKPGEDPVEAARRELAEEVGLAAEHWEVLADVATSPGFTDEALRVFLARGLTEVGREVAQGDEETDLVIRRYPLAELVGMVFAGDIVNAGAVVGVLAAQTALAGGGQTRPADAGWPDRPTRLAARPPLS
ncbi:MAG TPA: NUDIX hydrolase [Pseudonocardiaceae bacterium]|nr:NUDIX hydrolase [Pseudonocardiaceae bacterium]